MAKQSGQRFIKRNRPPRVHITYDDPTNVEEKIELPFVMGVMSDLSGNSPGVEKVDIKDRNSSTSIWTISTTGWRPSSPASAFA